MADKITAKQAFNLHPDRIAEQSFEEIDALIDGAARLGKTEIRVPYEYQRLMKMGSGSCPRLDVGYGKILADEYRSRGFAVNEIYECRQFVDTGVKISWSDDTWGDDDEEDTQARA